MTVNHGVLGSSPRGGAKEKAFGRDFEGFFVFRWLESVDCFNSIRRTSQTISTSIYPFASTDGFSFQSLYPSTHLDVRIQPAFAPEIIIHSPRQLWCAARYPTGKSKK